MFLAGTTRLELANQLIEGQSAFHFAFIPKRFQISNFKFQIVRTLAVRTDHL
jgi:hypothetical protein